MRPALLALCLAACSGDANDDPPADDVDTDADADADTDTDTDADTDSDTDADADTDADPVARLRVIHTAPRVPAQDLLGNGVPGEPPMVDLPALAAWPPTGWVTRPPNVTTFELFDPGFVDAWATFDGTLAAGGRHTIVIHGEPDNDDDTGSERVARGALFLDEDFSTLAPALVRIRWTHVAPSLAAVPVELRDAVTDVSYATLSYADSVTVELPAEPMNVYVDLDGNGACDPGEAFESFTRDAGEYFHVFLTAEADDTLVLLGLSQAAALAKRVGVPCP